MGTAAARLIGITTSNSRAKPDNTEQQWTSSAKQPTPSSRLAALFVRNAEAGKKMRIQRKVEVKTPNKLTTIVVLAQTHRHCLMTLSILIIYKRERSI